MTLHWDAPFAIILELMETYPTCDVEALGLEQLHQMIVTLPNFNDDPELATDKFLEAILWEWYEEVSA